jgi:hypothetical protein
MAAPSWPKWKELMQRDLASQVERALAQGEMTQRDLEDFTVQSMGQRLAFMPGSQVTAPMLAEALLSRELPPESPIALIETYLTAAMVGDSPQMAQVVEAGLEMSPASEMDEEQLVSLSPVERLQRIVASMAMAEVA